MSDDQARIDNSDKSNPMLRIDVGDYGYGFSVQMLSAEDQEWLLSVLSRQMQDIHDRAVINTKLEFQQSLRSLAGL